MTLLKPQARLSNDISCGYHESHLPSTMKRRAYLHTIAFVWSWANANIGSLKFDSSILEEKNSFPSCLYIWLLWLLGIHVWRPQSSWCICQPNIINLCRELILQGTMKIRRVGHSFAHSLIQSGFTEHLPVWARHRDAQPWLYAKSVVCEIRQPWHCLPASLSASFMTLNKFFTQFTCSNS